MVASGKMRSKAWWRGCFARQAESHMPIQEFCSQEQVAVSSFYTWKKRLLLKNPAVEKGAEAVRTKLKEPIGAGTTKEQLFIPIHLNEPTKLSAPVDFNQSTHRTSTNSSKLEVLLSNGNIVRLQATHLVLLDVINFLARQ